jgi:hypothetical protein
MDNVEAAALLKGHMEAYRLRPYGRGGPLRVLGSIDDGGWRALSPLCDDFVLAPDGRFVGE